jgi:hypothetical protein
MDLAYDKSLAYDSWSINRKKENMRPVNYNNVDIIELKYAVFYKNGEPVYHHLAGIEVDEFIDYDGVDNEYYQTIFSVSDQNSLLMYYLDSRFIPGKEKLTYWEFFNQVFEDDICIPSSISFLSLNETEKLCNRNVWEGFTDKNATFNLPKKISDQAKIEIKLIRPEIEDSIMFNYMSMNYLFVDFPYRDSGFSFTEEYKNLSLFLPFSNMAGYKNLSYLICSELRNVDLAYFEWTEEKYFQNKFNAEEISKIIGDADVLYRNIIDVPHGLDMDSVFVVFPAFYLLTLSDEGNSYPLAIAPYSMERETALFSVVFNQAFRNILFKYEIYMPGHSAISFGEYFGKELYDAEIISSKNISQNEWKEILPKLK